MPCRHLIWPFFCLRPREGDDQASKGKLLFRREQNLDETKHFPNLNALGNSENVCESRHLGIVSSYHRIWQAIVAGLSHGLADPFFGMTNQAWKDEQ